MYNKNSILYNIPEEQIATHSLEAKGKNIWLICIFLKIKHKQNKRKRCEWLSQKLYKVYFVLKFLIHPS